jgi:glycosyltransferase involved in cell wall biosynthesis
LAEAAFRSGSRFKKPFWSIVQRPSLRWVTCFHATAPTEVEDIRRHGFEQPIALIPNGIDVPTLERRAEARRTMLYLGRIHPNKQVDVLVRAWARVEDAHPDWQLRIVGPDNDARGFLEEMRRLADSLGLSRIAFDGELTGDSKLDAYRTSDAYVLPTKTENFGITIAEALAAGTPVITTTGAPWPELSARGAGWWIDQGEEPLVAALEDAMSRSRQELESMGRNGRRWMLNDFEWRTIASKMLDFYEWIAGGMEESHQLPWIDVSPNWRRRRNRKR